MHRIAKAPASSANLGPGFDTLAVALGLYLEVEISDRPDGLVVQTEGEGSDLPRGASHLAARVVAEVLGHDRAHIKVRSEIPVARGLGSSAALAVAAAAAAGACEPFEWGVRTDGHPENAAASAFGGLVAAAMLDGEPLARSLALDPELSFVVVVPDRRLSTAAARDLLPGQVPHQDAVFNLSRLGLLVAGLADHSQLVASAGDDRLHQEARSALFPEASLLLEGLRDAGALTSCWSGAGPSVLGICTRDTSPSVAKAARELMSELAVLGDVLELPPDLGGVMVHELG
ncbi:MAG TPA: homoserine kinase [Acidimicrobiales bacterium]|nr:homoserine kinase [Acidimicrobiales bacterium]